MDLKFGSKQKPFRAKPRNKLEHSTGSGISNKISKSSNEKCFPRNHSVTERLFNGDFYRILAMPRALREVVD